MKISKQIDKLQKLAKGLADETADYVMVLIEHNRKEDYWYAVVAQETSGDGRPEYIDTVVHDDGRLVVDGVGKTMVGALRDLEKCIIKNLKPIPVR